MITTLLFLAPLVALIGGFLIGLLWAAKEILRDAKRENEKDPHVGSQCSTQPM
jgi:hypothetical protein